MKVGSLFSGIGGLDLGLERAGMQVIWNCENDPYCSRVLAKHWPTIPNLGDITQIDWSGVERVELICGGFPCQPASLAGKRKGRDDERWLWPVETEDNPEPGPVLMAFKTNPQPTKGCSGWYARTDFDPRMFASINKETFVRVVGNEMRGLARDVADEECKWRDDHDR